MVTIFIISVGIVARATHKHCCDCMIYFIVLVVVGRSEITIIKIDCRLLNNEAKSEAITQKIVDVIYIVTSKVCLVLSNLGCQILES
jgi:hypothetical protein